MNDYEAKRQARIERYRARAERARNASNASLQTVDRIGSMIPFGQPILVGHHSEGRHRRDLARIDNAFRKAHESHKLAEHYDQKAAAAESNNAISSDDPEAIDRLREKLADLEARQSRMRAVNAAYRAFAKNPASLDKSTLSDSDKALIRSFVCERWQKGPYESYQMSNNLANVKRVQQRIAQLEAQAVRASESPAEPIMGDGWRIEEDTADNRLLILFDAKPGEELRKRFKQSGFRWSPTRGAWCRQLNNAARSSARYALGVAQ